MKKSGLALLLVLVFAPPAYAELGGKVATLQADKTQMKATMRSTSIGNYALHTLTTDNGTKVDQYARADGTIFAVTWDGPARPNLRQLFGSYFERFQADNKVRSGVRQRRPLASDHADFIVRSAGNGGASWGYAYLPKRVPVGFSPENLTVLEAAQ